MHDKQDSAVSICKLQALLLAYFTLQFHLHNTILLCTLNSLSQHFKGKMHKQLLE